MTITSLDRRFNSKVAINKINIESLPSFIFTAESEIIPYGIDNLYPFRVLKAIKESPTASGCRFLFSEFIFGNGIGEGGKIVVNREGETLNDIIWQCTLGYSSLYGFGIHCNFNALGQICEMFFINNEYMRLNRDMKSISYGLWNYHSGFFVAERSVKIDLYGKCDIFEKLEKFGYDYRGQVVLFSKDAEIYPTSPFDPCIVSASYERESQIYPYANIKNGFSGNTIVKLATSSGGENGKEEINELQKNLEKLHGSEVAGSSLVVEIPVNLDGEPSEYKMVEHLSPTNVDNLFKNQNETAERSILKTTNTPMILLGVDNSGMFNEASYIDAFNYKNERTESNRKDIERFFNKILPNSIFGIDEIQIVPFSMKQKQSGY